MIGWRGWNALRRRPCHRGRPVAGRHPARRTGRGGRAATRTSVRAALSPQVLGLLGTGVAERICYGLAAVYYATFLQAIYGLSLGAIAIPLFLFALGNVLGTVLGGQIADRVRDRLLTFAVTMAASGFAALALFTWHPSPAISVGLGFLYVMLNALGRPSFMAALAAVPDNVRGTVLGLNGTSAAWAGSAPRRWAP